MFKPSKYQQALFDWIDSGTGNAIVKAVAGSGKCLGRGTPVMKYDGTIVRVEDVETGDRLMGPDSRPRTVLSTSSGTGPLYRITPVKGDSWVCNDVHVLTLVHSLTGKVFDIDLPTYRIERGSRFLSDSKLFRVPVDFRPKEVPYDPYVVGLWLGDGTKGIAQFTSHVLDTEIHDYLSRFATSHGLFFSVRADKRNQNVLTINLSIGKKGKTDPGSHKLRQFFRYECFLNGEKRVPRPYLLNSRSNRLKLLAGLIDTDGYHGTGCLEITTKYPGLRDDILFLARSLGYAAYAVEKEAMGNVYQRISISGDLHELPCQLPRKQVGVRRQKKNVLRTGFSLDRIEDGEYFGFTLDGDGRFLLGDFTVTHNTTSLIEAIKRMQHSGSVLLCAFNKSIAQELESKIREAGAGRNVVVKTYHAFGMGIISKNIDGRVNVYDGKLDDLMTEVIDDKQEQRRVQGVVRKMVQLCKGFLLDGTSDDLEWLIERYGVEADFIPMEQLTLWVKEILRRSLEMESTIDFDDMIYIPAIRLRDKEWRPTGFDWIMSDECFTGNTPVTMANGSSKTIKEIVETRCRESVLSFDPGTGMIRSRKIVGWHKVPRRGRHLRRIGSMCGTADHPIYTRNGYLRLGMVDKLPNVEILCLHENLLGERQADSAAEVDHSRLASWRRVRQTESGTNRECAYPVRSRDEANHVSGLEVSRASALDSDAAFWSDGDGVRRRDMENVYDLASGVHRSVSSLLFDGKEEDHLRSRQSSQSIGPGRLVHGRRIRISDRILHPTFDICPTNRGCSITRGLVGIARGPIEDRRDSERPCHQNTQSRARRLCSPDLRSPSSDVLVQTRRSSANSDCSRSFGLFFETRGSALQDVWNSVQEIAVARVLQCCLPEESGSSSVAGLETTQSAQVRAPNLLSGLWNESLDHHEMEETADNVQSVMCHETEPSDEEEWVYCIDVEDDHNFFAGGVLVHNCQDLNEAQRVILVNSLKRNGRLVAVGDEKQAIYGFRGADPDSMTKLQEQLNAVTLPLSVCYRCPTSHLDLARQYVPEIEPREGAPAGIVEDRPFEQALQMMDDHDLVLCRKNAPLVKAAFALLSRGKKAMVKGRDIGKGLVGLIEKMNTSDFHKLLDRLNEHCSLEVAKWVRLEKFSRAEQIQDQVDCIMAIASGVDSVIDLKAKIEKIFSDTVYGTVFSSVHRAKGLEAHRTFILERETMPMRWRGQQDWAFQQELNILYVALTRSKSEMYFVGPSNGGMKGPLKEMVVEARPSSAERQMKDMVNDQSGDGENISSSDYEGPLCPCGAIVQSYGYTCDLCTNDHRRREHLWPKSCLPMKTNE